MSRRRVPQTKADTPQCVKIQPLNFEETSHFGILNTVEVEGWIEGKVCTENHSFGELKKGWRHNNSQPSSINVSPKGAAGSFLKTYRSTELLTTIGGGRAKGKNRKKTKKNAAMESKKNVYTTTCVVVVL